MILIVYKTLQRPCAWCKNVKHPGGLARVRPWQAYCWMMTRPESSTDDPSDWDDHLVVSLSMMVLRPPGMFITYKVMNNKCACRLSSTDHEVSFTATDSTILVIG